MAPAFLALVKMTFQLNRGKGSTWSAMERELASLAQNNKVRAVVSLHYKGDSDVPTKITFDAYISDSAGNVTKRRWRHTQ
jgi:hypothetical protein